MIAITVFLIALLLPLVTIGQEETSTTARSQPVCSVNQLFNGQICTCAPGYFSSSNDESKVRCEDECEEVRPRLWASIGVFCVFAAACATLLFTIPMCIATCASCLHAKKRLIYTNDRQL
ncbi:hypothetical protein DICVIV_02192 [Dictyocaulus viviparus]|uniref:Uncharacterized protein n=1 Tax=Dictyocaulus viviparus TaxID=29172 RepID=A0A0D8YAN8_DICVI|nr:hypothetical protein DICVIV_02192 [Dictyocaulus viviparus]